MIIILRQFIWRCNSAIPLQVRLTNNWWIRRWNRNLHPIPE